MLKSFNAIIYLLITCTSFRATRNKGSLFYLTNNVSFLPHPTKCVGCRPVVFVNTIIRQEAVKNLSDKIVSYIYIYIVVVIFY